MTAEFYSFKHKGKTHKLPLLTALPMGAIRKARKAVDEGDKMFIILESFLDEDSDTLKAIDTMDSAEFAKLLSGWSGGAGLGE
jgi:hypothetical protein